MKKSFVPCYADCKALYFDKEIGREAGAVRAYVGTREGECCFSCSDIVDSIPFHPVALAISRLRDLGSIIHSKKNIKYCTAIVDEQYHRLCSIFNNAYALDNDRSFIRQRNTLTYREFCFLTRVMCKNNEFAVVGLADDNLYLHEMLKTASVSIGDYFAAFGALYEGRECGMPDSGNLDFEESNITVDIQDVVSNGKSWIERLLDAATSSGREDAATVEHKETQAQAPAALVPILNSDASASEDMAGEDRDCRRIEASCGSLSFYAQLNATNDDIARVLTLTGFQALDFVKVEPLENNCVKFTFNDVQIPLSDNGATMSVVQTVNVLYAKVKAMQKQLVDVLQTVDSCRRFSDTLNTVQ